MAWLAFVIPVLALLLAMPGTTYAQRMTAELNGTVVDESGGVIPGADVLLINEDSRTERRSVTNADGFFAFSAVPAATYTIQISLQGFSTYEVTGIPLNAGDSRSLRDLPLKVAAMAETVSVTAEVQLTPLNSGEKSTTLTSEVIENIPIVSSSAAELLRVLPGMTPANTGTQNKPAFTGEIIGINGNGEGGDQSMIGNISANGTQTIALDITVDGAPGADPGCNCATSVNPNTEFIQEFKVLQSSFGAEYAKGPNSMTVVSKSGGRDFHGSAFLYFRDYHLNSNNWERNAVGQERVENKFVYPGFTFSGPLTLGGFNKDRDKVFFFVGYEYYQQRLDTGLVRSWVPTDAMRGGDFSELPSLGLTGDGINSIPEIDGVSTPVLDPGSIDPAGQLLLGLLPQPNADPGVTGGWNYFDNLLVDQPNHQFLTRVDFNISDNTKAFVRYNLQRETQNFVIGLWWRQGEFNVPFPTTITAPNRSDSITGSLTHVFDPTLTSETILAFTYIDFPNQFEDRSKVERGALGYPYQGIFGNPNQHVPSTYLGSWGQGPRQWAPGGFDPVLFATKWQWAFTQNVTKVWGTHTAKFGFFWEWIRNAQPGNDWSNGLIDNNQNNDFSSGNAFADLLLGRVINYNESSLNVVRDIDWNRWELYGQDSWKMSPSFTLNYGARFSIFEPWSDYGGNGIVVFDQSILDSDRAADERFPGITYNRRDSSVPMQGVDTSFFVQPRVGFAWDVRGTGETVLRGGFGMYLFHDAQQPYNNLVDFSAGFRSTSARQTTLAAIENLPEGDVVFNANAIDRTDDTQPRTYNWSLSVNQRLPWSMNAEVSYVGNKSDKLINSGGANINAVPLGAMLADPNGNPDNYRPIPEYGGLSVYRHNMYANYHSLQALLARQRGRFNFTLAYTFSKALGLRGAAEGGVGLSEYIHLPYRSFNYGVLPYDRTHVASATFSWLLPEPSRDSGLKYHVLGGWQLAGILSYVDGAPMPVTSSQNFGMTGTGVGGVTLDNRNIAGSTDTTAFPLITCDPNSSVPDGFMWNPDCFAAPSPGANGDYVMPYMKGQSYNNVDFSVFKNFDLGGDKRLQLRANMYNAFNHPIAYPTNDNLTLRFEDGVPSNPNFGRLPDNNKFGRRIIQLAVRFTF
jgi:hypothetical protein